jgi:hypothetical protein
MFLDCSQQRQAAILKNQYPVRNGDDGGGILIGVL